MRVLDSLGNSGSPAAEDQRSGILRRSIWQPERSREIRHKVRDCNVLTQADYRRRAEIVCESGERFTRGRSAQYGAGRDVAQQWFEFGCGISGVQQAPAS